MYKFENLYFSLMREKNMKCRFIDNLVRLFLKMPTPQIITHNKIKQYGNCD
jgi:hypothetical protein